MAQSQSSDALRRAFPRGAVVPIVLRHVSRSGLQRTFDVLEPGTLRSLRHEVADATGCPVDNERSGVTVQGAGMDMAFRLTYLLGENLYGDGYALSYELL